LKRCCLGILKNQTRPNRTSTCFNERLRSGYQLVQPQAQQIELSRFFLKRLPAVHRHIGPMSLEDALTILTAPAFKLNQDPVRRLISYELDTRFAGETL